jgi:hypothetical protein
MRKEYEPNLTNFAGNRTKLNEKGRLIDNRQNVQQVGGLSVTARRIVSTRQRLHPIARNLLNNGGGGGI